MLRAFLFHFAIISEFYLVERNHKTASTDIWRGGEYLSYLGIFNFWPKNQGLRSKKDSNLEYRQLLTSIKRFGSIAPKLRSHRRKENFCQNVENRDSGEMAHFQEFWPSPRKRLSLGHFWPIHLISFAYENWQPILGVEWGNLDWSP